MSSSKTITNLLGLIIVLTLSIYFFIYNHDELLKLQDIKITTLLLLSALVLSTQLINGLRLKYLTSCLMLKLQAKQWLGIAISQSFLNYLPLKGGMLANAMYLKRRHDFPYTNFVAMTGASVIITNLTAGIVGLASSFTLFLAGNVNLFPTIFFATLVLGASIFIACANKIPHWKGKLGSKISIILDGCNIIRQSPATIISLVILDLLSVVIFACRYFVAFEAFSSSAPFWYFLIFAPMSILSTFISFTPAGLGIRETIIGLTSKYVGTGLYLGMFAASLDRAMVMFWVFLLGPIFSYVLLGAAKSSS